MKYTIFRVCYENKLILLILNFKKGHIGFNGT
jgi:hypothetical protein